MTSWVEMVGDPRTQIERRHANVVGVRQSRSNQRIDDGEGLDRLLRGEIVAVALVGNGETGSDEGNAPDAVGAGVVILTGLCPL